MQHSSSASIRAILQRAQKEVTRKMPAEIPNLSDEEITRLWGALRSELNRLSVQNIRNTAAAAGIDVTQVPATSEARTGLGSRAEVMPAIDRLFGAMSRQGRITALRVLAERLTDNEQSGSVQEILGKHGFQFIAGRSRDVRTCGAEDIEFGRHIPASILVGSSCNQVTVFSLDFGNVTGGSKVRGYFDYPEVMKSRLAL